MNSCRMKVDGAVLLLMLVVEGYVNECLVLKSDGRVAKWTSPVTAGLEVRLSVHRVVLVMRDWME
jgi:hypothetical protein